MSKYFIISDAHLGAESPHEEQLKMDRLYSFLAYVAREQAHLIICGDLFDFWFEYRHAVPRLHFHVLSQLAQLSRKGHELHYVAGNHDFWLGSFMQNQIGLILHLDEFELVDGKFNILLKHGDGLVQKDHLYRLLKRVLRNRFNISLYRLLHPDIGVPLALFFSTLSRKASKNRRCYSDMDYRHFAYSKLDQGYDLVVLGHSHWPALEKFHRGYYMNAGHWMNPFTFCIIQDGKPAIRKWDGVKARRFKLEFPPGNPRPMSRRVYE
jgi:UDP-2,3-diacylglucosamine hydrolase